MDVILRLVGNDNRGVTLSVHVPIALLRKLSEESTLTVGGALFRSTWGTIDATGNYRMKSFWLPSLDLAEETAEHILQELQVVREEAATLRDKSICFSF